MADLDANGHELRNGLRYPWPQAPESGQVREVAAGVWWLRMPLPFRLDHINLYLLRHTDGWVVVDTGMNTEQSREVWDRVLGEVCGGLPVRAVVCTHFHSDHAGLAAWLSERYHCPVYMTASEFQALHVRFPRDEPPGWDFLDFYRKAGVADDHSSEMFKVMSNAHFLPAPLHHYRRLHEGSRLNIGGRTWHVVIGRGHSPEHACLYAADDDLLISGDQVLPRITSTVGVHATEPLANPLKDWLDSIEHLRSLPDSVLVLPAHERPFFNLHQRLDQLDAHHRTHLAQLLAHCDAPCTALELMNVLFPKLSGRFDELMALGETLAHANYLVAEGALVREEDRGVHRYRCAAEGECAAASNTLFQAATLNISGGQAAAFQESQCDQQKQQ